MKHSSRYAILTVSLVLFALLITMTLPLARASEPSLEMCLDHEGFTQRTLVSTQTFPAGTYNVTFYAEWAGYRDQNELYWYPVGGNISSSTMIFAGSDGVPIGQDMGYVDPPQNKSFTSNSQFGLSLKAPDSESPFYTETSRNPGSPHEQHAKIYQSNSTSNPNLYFIGFENMGGASGSDFDFNDMVVSIQLENYLQVISPYDSPNGGGWYYNGTTAYASLTNGNLTLNNGTRRVFTQWSGDASGTNYQNSDPILMNQNMTAIAQWQTQYNLTVGTAPNGLAIIPGQDWYNENQNVTLTAPAVSGYNFTYWDVDGSAQMTGLNPLTVNMNGPHTATAHYAQIFTLTIITTSGGSTTPPIGNYTFTAGSTSQVTAVANGGYQFDHWELDGATVGSANPYTVLMNSNHTLNATFVASSPPQTSQTVGGYSYSLQTVESPQPLTIYLSFVAVSAVVITAVSRRRKSLQV